MIETASAPQESEVRNEIFRRLQGVGTRLGYLSAVPVRHGGSPPFAFVGPISEIADGVLPGPIGMFDRDYIVTVVCVLDPYWEASGPHTTYAADDLAADLRVALEGIENDVFVAMDSTQEPSADDIRQVVNDQSGALPPALAVHLRVRGVAS